MLLSEVIFDPNWAGFLNWILTDLGLETKKKKKKKKQII